MEVPLGSRKTTTKKSNAISISNQHIGLYHLCKNVLCKEELQMAIK